MTQIDVWSIMDTSTNEGDKNVRTRSTGTSSIELDFSGNEPQETQL